MADNRIIFFDSDMEEQDLENFDLFYQDYMDELDKSKTANDNLVCYADLGRYDGRVKACKEYGTSVKECLQSIQSNFEFVCFFENNDLQVKQYHHDGVNNITIRQWNTYTSDDMRERVLEAIYNNEPNAYGLYMKSTKSVKELLPSYLVA